MVQTHACQFLTIHFVSRIRQRSMILLHQQGVMSISEAMMIPAQNTPLPSSGQAGRAQQMNMPSNVPTANRTEGWNGSNWPASFSRAQGLSMGTSPFGRSVDMVDMATQLMEAGRGELTRQLQCCSLLAATWHIPVHCAVVLLLVYSNGATAVICITSVHVSVSNSV